MARAAVGTTRATRSAWYAAQPFPRVFPAFDFAGFDVPFDAKVFPAFDSAPLLGLPLLFATMITSSPSPTGVRESTDNRRRLPRQPVGKPVCAPVHAWWWRHRAGCFYSHSLQVGFANSVTWPESVRS